MKFSYAIGNPPYQGDYHQQIYTDFYLETQQIANTLSLIFPIGWQEPKNANNLSKLNKPKIKEDPQIVLINNIQGAFDGVAGADWTNIIIWKSGYNNGLNGNQKILTNGTDEKIVHLHCDTSQIQKPEPLIKLYELVKNYGDFKSFASIVSHREPYKVDIDFEKLSNIKNNNDTKIYIKGNCIKYLNSNISYIKTTGGKDFYKIFVPYAWGNMGEKCGLGGAYANIIIGMPNEICSGMYLEIGKFESFEKAQYTSKYIMSKFLRALLYLNKFSHHITTSWEAIPIQDYSESWWTEDIDSIDEHLFNKYNVPENIRQFVKDNIQLRTEKNIINYNIKG